MNELRSLGKAGEVSLEDIFSVSPVVLKRLRLPRF
jgi:hypothetical protein